MKLSDKIALSTLAVTIVAVLVAIFVPEIRTNIFGLDNIGKNEEIKSDSKPDPKSSQKPTEIETNNGLDELKSDERKTPKKNPISEKPFGLSDLGIPGISSLNDFPIIDHFELKYRGVSSIAISHTDRGPFRFDWKMTARLTYLHELLGYRVFIIPIPNTKRSGTDIYDAFLVYTKELGPELLSSNWSSHYSELTPILSKLKSGNYFVFKPNSSIGKYYKIIGQNHLFDPNWTRVDIIGDNGVNEQLGFDWSLVSRIDYLLHAFPDMEVFIRPIDSTLKYVRNNPYYLGLEIWTKSFGPEILLSNRLDLVNRRAIFQQTVSK